MGWLRKLALVTALKGTRCQIRIKAKLTWLVLRGYEPYRKFGMVDLLENIHIFSSFD